MDFARALASEIGCQVTVDSITQPVRDAAYGKRCNGQTHFQARQTERLRPHAGHDEDAAIEVTQSLLRDPAGKYSFRAAGLPGGALWPFSPEEYFYGAVEQAFHFGDSVQKKFATFQTHHTAAEKQAVPHGAGTLHRRVDEKRSAVHIVETVRSVLLLNMSGSGDR